MDRKDPIMPVWFEDLRIMCDSHDPVVRHMLDVVEAIMDYVSYAPASLRVKRSLNALRDLVELEK